MESGTQLSMEPPAPPAPTVRLWVILPNECATLKRIILALALRAKAHGTLRNLAEVIFRCVAGTSTCADSAMSSIPAPADDLCTHVIVAYHTYITAAARPLPVGMVHVLLNPEHVHNSVEQRRVIGPAGSVLSKANLCDLCNLFGIGMHGLARFPGIRTDTQRPERRELELAWQMVIEDTSVTGLAHLGISAVLETVWSKLPEARERLARTRDDMLAQSVLVTWTQPEDELSVESDDSADEGPPTDANGERLLKPPRTSIVLIVPLASSDKAVQRTMLLRTLRYGVSHEAATATQPVFCGVVYRDNIGALQLQLAYYSTRPPTAALTGRRASNLLLASEGPHLLPAPWRWRGEACDPQVYVPMPLSAAPPNVQEAVATAFDAAEVGQAGASAQQVPPGLPSPTAPRPPTAPPLSPRSPAPSQSS